ncbi:MAG: hypothetical protein V3U31_05980 [Dehalococcoidia bacterium]
MSPIRLLYAASLVLLGVLLALAVLRPTVAPSYSEVQRVQLLERPDQWVVEFSIIHRGKGDMGYTIEVLEEGRRSTQNIVLQEGRTFTYIYHIYRDDLESGRANFTLYREGEERPIEQLTYYLLDPEA